MASTEHQRRSPDPGMFAGSPAEFRPVPFWGINDRLDDAELRRQVAAMRSGGWGGFFVHPRYGMETPYLSPEYLQRMRAIRDAGAAEGLDMWLYDEHPFPSGSAGGLVAADRRDLRHRVLAVNLHTRLTPIAEGVAYFGVEPGEVPAFDAIGDPAGYDGGHRWFAHFYEWEMPVAPSAHRVGDNGFIHGFPYADLLNPEAGRRFIELTYDAYAKAVGDSFGTVVKGAFSDMPLYHWHYASPHPSVPWTSRLPELFGQRYRYDLLPVLPALFYDVPGYERVRHDFWLLVSDLFVENFTAPLAAWCREHDLTYIAHYWGEETLPWQVAWTGDVMHHFTHHDYVGCDHILRNTEDAIGVKQAATVAEQLGKARTVAETYALSGHNLTYDERKWIGEWEYALGINFLVPYVPSYSMRGRRKRDEPPSQFIQQPYWPHEAHLSGYFARLGYALTSGQRVVDTLLLQPLSTAYSLYRPSHEIPPAWHPNTEDPFDGGGAELHGYSAAFIAIADGLLRAHRDFHLGNERIMAEHAGVRDGKLAVGGCAYRVVIVPPSLTWEASTVRLLAEFAAAGGTVIAIEPVPSRVAGQVAEDVLPAHTTIVADLAAAVRAADEVSPASVVLREAPDVLCHHRQCGAQDVVFLVNTSRSRSYRDIEVRLRGCEHGGGVERWDPLTGERSSLAWVPAGPGEITVRLDFTPGGSHLLVFPSAPATPALRPHPAELAALRTAVAIDDPWTVEPVDRNAVVLDYSAVRIGNGAWEGPWPTWQAHEHIRRAGPGSRFRLRFTSRISELPEHLALAVERPGEFDITVNGTRIGNDGPAWWDPGLRLLDIRGVARTGENVIELAGTCRLDTEIEPLYLTGDFAVSPGAPFEITRSAGKLQAVNLVTEGYPSYAGRFRLRQQFQWTGEASQAWVAFDRIDAIAARISLNDRDAGFLAWPPYRLDVSGLLVPGRNLLEVELATSLHNLLGPHHDRRGEARHFVLDRAWMDAQNWTDDYFFVPVGLSGARIEVTPVA